MEKIKDNILIFLLLLACICKSCCQDFEPQPLFPKVTTTENIELPISTDAPTTSTLAPEMESTTAEAIPSPTTTVEPSTTTIEISTEGLPATTTPTPEISSGTTIVDTSTANPQKDSTTIDSISETTLPAWQPLQRCYFRKQLSRPQFYWTCEGPKWFYSMECFHCCQSEDSAFAGCNEVHFSYCE